MRTGANARICDIIPASSYEADLLTNKRNIRQDKNMEFRMPSYYKNFKCIADKCPDTCCAGWAIVIDDATLQKYENMQGKQGDYVRSRVDFEEQVYKREGVRCAFLHESGLCNLHGKVGEKYLCKTCARYPRHFEEYGNLVEAALTMSCPVAARLIIDRKESDNFRVRQTDQRSRHSREIDVRLLDALVGARKRMFSITGNRRYTIYNRMQQLLEYGKDVQEKVFRYERLKLRRYIDALHKTHYMTERSSENDIRNALMVCRQVRMHQYMDMLLGMENIDEKWPIMVEAACKTLYETMEPAAYEEAVQGFAAYMRGREYEYEHLLNYFIYTYYLGGVYDYNVQGMVKLAVVSTMLLWELGLCHWLTHGHEFTVDDQIVLCYRYSRQVEHSEDNLSSFEGILTAHPLFQERELFMVLESARKKM